MNQLENKVALITGGASRPGLGSAIADKFATEGAFVFLTDIDESGCDASLDIIRNNGGQGAALKHNVTDEVAALSATLDSDYIAERSREATPDYVDIKHYSVATVPPGVHGRMIFVTDGNAGAPCLAVYDSSGGFYRRIVLGAAVNT